MMISISSNFFFNVTLPVTLWFFDKRKSGERKDKVLFIDAREIFNQVDRAHRDFRPEQLEFISNIVRMYRGNNPESSQQHPEFIPKSSENNSKLVPKITP